MKKGEKLSPEKKARMLARQKATLEARKKEKEAAETVNSVPISPIETVGGITVDIAGATPPDAPKSLLDRIKKGMKQPPTPEKGKGKGDQAESNFLFAFVPLASGFLAYYAGRFWSDEYQVCAPTAEEVSAVLTPLVRLMSRYLDVHLSETPDIRDIRLSLTALLLYIVRSAKLSIEITHRLEEKIAVEHAEKHTNAWQYTGAYQGSSGTVQKPGTNGDARGRASESSDFRASGNTQGTLGRETGGSVPGNESRLDPSTYTTDAEYARALIAESYQQDRAYRALHGLL